MASNPFNVLGAVAIPESVNIMEWNLKANSLATRASLPNSNSVPLWCQIEKKQLASPGHFPATSTRCKQPASVRHSPDKKHIAPLGGKHPLLCFSTCLLSPSTLNQAATGPIHRLCISCSSFRSVSFYQLSAARLDLCFRVSTGIFTCSSMIYHPVL